MAEDSTDPSKRLPLSSALDSPNKLTGSAVPKPEGLAPEEEEKINGVSERLRDRFDEGTMQDLVETDKGKGMSINELLLQVFRF